MNDNDVIMARQIMAGCCRATMCVTMSCDKWLFHKAYRLGVRHGREDMEGEAVSQMWQQGE